MLDVFTKQLYSIQVSQLYINIAVVQSDVNLIYMSSIFHKTNLLSLMLLGTSSSCNCHN